MDYKVYIYVLKGVSILKACLHYSYHHARSFEFFAFLPVWDHTNFLFDIYLDWSNFHNMLSILENTEYWNW